jgi:hypothetical protein
MMVGRRWENVRQSDSVLHPILPTGDFTFNRSKVQVCSELLSLCGGSGFRAWCPKRESAFCDSDCKVRTLASGWVRSSSEKEVGGISFWRSCSVEIGHGGGSLA